MLSETGFLLNERIDSENYLATLKIRSGPRCRTLINLQGMIPLTLGVVYNIATKSLSRSNELIQLGFLIVCVCASVRSRTAEVRDCWWVVGHLNGSNEGLIDSPVRRALNQWGGGSY